MRPEQVRLARQWIAKAEEDLLNAERTLSIPENCPVGTVCFHAQQCVEKYLKALLTCRTIEFPKTHDLVALVNRLGGADALGLRLEDVQPLNRYSIESRYPGDWEPIDFEEASEAVEKSRRVRGRIREMLTENVLNTDG